jgi:hypothetical protein
VSTRMMLHARKWVIKQMILVYLCIWIPDTFLENIIQWMLVIVKLVMTVTGIRLCNSVADTGAGVSLQKRAAVAHTWNL